MLTNIFQMGWNHQLTRKLHYLAHEKYTSNLGLSQPLQTNHSLASFVDKLGRSTSHHPDYYIFSRESWIKPSFATISHYYWEGGQPTVEFTKLGLDLVFECFFLQNFRGTNRKHCTSRLSIFSGRRCLVLPETFLAFYYYISVTTSSETKYNQLPPLAEENKSTWCRHSWHSYYPGSLNSIYLHWNEAHQLKTVSSWIESRTAPGNLHPFYESNHQQHTMCFLLQAV